MMNNLLFYKGKNGQIIKAEKVFIWVLDISIALNLARGLRISFRAYHAIKGTVN